MSGRRAALATIVVGATSLCLLAATPANPAPLKWDPRGLTFQLTSRKAMVSLYEPVVLSYTLRNAAEAEITVPGDLEFGAGHTTLSIRHPDGRVVEFRDRLMTYMSPPPMALRPHQAVTEDVVLFFNGTSEDLAFPEPGDYVITGGVHVGNDSGPVIVRGEPLKMRIAELSERDRRAIEALGSLDRVTALFRVGARGYCGKEPAETCAETPRSFLRQYGDTSYAPAVTYYYADGVASGALPIGPQDENAEALQSGFLRRWPDHPFEPMVRAALILGLHAAGRRPQALELLHSLEQEYPDRSGMLRRLRARIE